MYIDKLNNKISEEMYERLLIKFGDEIKQKEKEYMEIKQLNSETFERSSGQGANPYRRYSPRAVLADSVKLRSRQYSLDGRSDISFFS